MNLFAIVGTLWQHKRVMIPVILLTIFGMLYIVAVQNPTYQAKASVLLTNPPTPPTSAQIAADPSLAGVNTYNPLASLGNLVLVADVLIEVVTSPVAKQALVQAGANPGYQVASDVSLETPPAIDITGVGSNAQSAVQSAQLVADAISRDLTQIQVNQHVNSKYMISSVEYLKPTSATTSSSGKLRTMIVVVAIGFILLLVAVSVSQAFEERKNGRQRQGRKPASHAGSHHEPVNSPTAGMYDRPQWAAMRMSEPQPASPAHRPQMGPARDDNYRDQIG